MCPVLPSTSLVDLFPLPLCKLSLHLLSSMSGAIMKAKDPTSWLVWIHFQRLAGWRHENIYKLCMGRKKKLGGVRGDKSKRGAPISIPLLLSIACGCGCGLNGARVWEFLLPCGWAWGCVLAELTQHQPREFNPCFGRPAALSNSRINRLQREGMLTVPVSRLGWDQCAYWGCSAAGW